MKLLSALGFDFFSQRRICMLIKVEHRWGWRKSDTDTDSDRVREATVALHGVRFGGDVLP